MRKIAAISTLCLLLLGTMPGPALADNPSFHSADASASGLQLSVSFKETGLGNLGVTNINITVSANATANYECINQGGNHPKGSTPPSPGAKETVNSVVGATGNFAIRNGSVSGTIKISLPGAGTFTCNGTQTLMLTSGTFSSIKISGAGVQVSTTPDSISVP